MEIEVSTKELQNQKLMIATPMYGGSCFAIYHKSMMDLTNLCLQLNIPIQYYSLSNESLITRARTYAADEFLRSDCTHLMFIDADIGFNAKDIIDLIGLTLYDKEKYNIIGGTYPKKCIAWEKIKLAVDKGLADNDPNNLENYIGDYVLNFKKEGEFKISEPIEVAELGTGFMLIPRNTLEKYAEAYPELKYYPDHSRTQNFNGSREITLFFDCTIDRGYKLGDLKNIVNRIANGETIKKEEAQSLLDKEKTATRRYLSEDYNFCKYASDIGLRSWVAPWIQLIHTGNFMFGGSLVNVLSLGASPNG